MADESTTISITGRSQGPKRTHIDTGPTEFVIGEASPLEHLLGSLAACINVIGHLVAKEHGFAIGDMDVHVEGDIDTRTYRGEATESRAGFGAVRVAVRVDADADAEQLASWLAAVEERCPVADNLTKGAELTVELERR